MNEVLYLSDTSSRRVYRLKTLIEPKDLAKNLEVVAGTGEQCLPFDQSHCGDGGKASEASLNNPRGKPPCAVAPAAPPLYVTSCIWVTHFLCLALTGFILG